jgi:acyl transferase domain-containing protein
VALFRLLESWGVRPSLLAGHSVGEIAAAHVAGVLSLADAATLVAARGRLMQALPAGGAMVAVAAGEDEVAPLLTERRLAIAAVNGPAAVVISGDQDAALAVAGRLAAAGRKTTRLRVSHAFHSHRMDGMLAAFADVVAGLEPRPPRIPVVSGLTGRLATPDELCLPDYWVRHARQPVRFADAVVTLAGAGATALVEFGPDGSLTAMSRDSLPDATLGVPLLRRGRPDARTLVTAVARLFCDGVPVDLDRVCPGRRVDLPTYAFQHRRYWPGLAPDRTGAPRPEPASTGATALARRLDGVPERQRERVALDLVRGLAAGILGHDGAGAVGPARPFAELGLDSLTAVELRNRLNAGTGLRLPASVLFDHPTPRALARHLLDRLDAGPAPEPASTPAEGDRPGRDELADRIGAATADDIFDLIDRELGAR